MTESLPRIAFYALLVWAPIPLGSNRPIFWAANAAVGSVILAALLLRRRRTVAEETFRTLVLIGLPPLLLIGWMIVQAAPWVPEALRNPAWNDAPSGGGAISINPSATLTTALGFLAVAMTGLIAARISMNLDRSLQVLRAVTASAVVVAVWGLAALGFGFPQTLFGAADSGGGLLTSFFVNRNSAATFLAIGMATALAMLMAKQRRDEGETPMRALVDLPNRAGPLLAIVLLLGLAVLATGSRAGALAGLIGVGVTYALGWRRNAWVAHVAIGVVLVGLGASVLFLGTTSEALFDRLAQLDLADESRWAVYRDTIAAILDEPLTGYGAGTFADFYPIYHGPDVPSSGIWLEAHNTYLQAAAELGVPAVAAAIAVLTGFTIMCARAAIRHGEPAALAAAGTAAVVGIHSLFDFSLQVQSVAMCFAAVLGAGIARSSARARHEREKAYAVGLRGERQATDGIPRASP
jgi:O-antigen ligase